MNRLCIVIFFFASIISSYSNPENTSIALDKAVKDGLVSCNIKGYKATDQKYQMISIVIKNLKQKSLNLLLDGGRTFRCSDTTMQDVIVMKKELFALSPSGTKEIPLFSMCIEMNDSYPDAGIDFAMGEMGNEKLLAVVQLVEKNKWFNAAAQNAVWSITDNLPLTNISDADTTITNRLRQLVSDVTGQKMVKAGEEYEDYYSEPQPEPVQRIAFKGEWEFTIRETSHVEIALFDDKKNLIERIVDENLTEPGTYKYTFSTSMIEINSKYYEVSLIINGKVLQSERYDL